MEKKKNFIIVLIIIMIIGCIVGGVLLYVNHPAVNLKSASQYALDREWDAAKSKVEGLTGDEAFVLRQYIELGRASDRFSDVSEEDKADYFSNILQKKEYLDDRLLSHIEELDDCIQEAKLCSQKYEEATEVISEIKAIMDGKEFTIEAEKRNIERWQKALSETDDLCFAVSGKTLSEILETDAFALAIEDIEIGYQFLLDELKEMEEEGYAEDEIIPFPYHRTNTAGDGAENNSEIAKAINDIDGYMNNAIEFLWELEYLRYGSNFYTSEELYSYLFEQVCRRCFAQ